ncbi:ParA family protein [Leptolinea tardivitalis]|uniref:Sporulation initiation inhibitor Soj n=1 Tax=Leptolinea tardivitalis TaxID=229920 RepID=A0A0P6XQL7_9CHLR|nr:ParA family protein [Leptolinea tardivitalis]KPL71765.1 sporulation initiation inhibitor Soj [Leptolinea tardivitalis]GAP20138.1 chromosome segregation ATPase [Leptolinea tardivitalis]
MTKIFTFVNQKGGVGKTTSAINLGAFLGYYGQRVLLVDLDPQANATSSLGIDKNTVKTGTYEVLIGAAQAAPHILHNPRIKISLLPSSPALAGADVELIDGQNRENRLRDVVNSVADRYDYILIDCPPSLSLLTVNGLMAAKDGVIIPVQCEYLALEGLGQLTQTINRVKNSLYPGLIVRGVILTMYDGRTRLAIDVVNEVRKHFPTQVFQSVIPRSIRLAEAPSYGIPISMYAPDSGAAKAYAALAREILGQDGISIPQVVEQEK